MMYIRHGQSAALQLIFAALGPVLLHGKASNLSPLKQNLTKFELNSSQEALKRFKNSAFAEIITGLKVARPQKKNYIQIVAIANPQRIAF